jgi:hypothetical protein
MRLMENMKRSIRSWLDIEPADIHTLSVKEGFDFQTNVGINRVWMRGQSSELEDLYGQIRDDQLDSASFWGSNPTSPIHKIHSGLPGLMVGRLTDIIVHDLDSVTPDKREDEWKKIEKENNLQKLIKTAVTEALSLGDGAFKISYDTEISKNPIIEFYSADRVDFKYKRGRLKEVIFKTIKREDHKKYMLKEHYGFGYVKYELFRVSGTDLELTDLKEIDDTADLENIAFGGYTEDSDGEMVTPGSYMMAEPFMIYDSSMYRGRGESIFDKKRNVFDAFDEVVSQWADAVRSGRSKTYIPEAFIPKDGNGRDLKPNAFDDRFIMVTPNMNEMATNQINVVQPTIPSDNYLQSYITYLDLCLQGIISPSTLGIDVKKLDNAEAQREKEKVTLYTRNAIIEALTSTLQKLVVDTLMTVDSLTDDDNPETQDIQVDVLFGEYANPSFEAVIETVTKAKTGGVMSVRSALDEMYGETKDDTWKDQEVVRISEDQGATQVPEPNVATDINENGSGMPVS